MDSTRITRAQAQKILDAISPTHGYLNRLRTRMEKLGFPPNDKYYVSVLAAEDALHTVWVHTHYMSVGSGCGEPPRE